MKSFLEKYEFLFVLIIILIILLLRRLDFIFYPQLYAEEIIFFTKAYFLGIESLYITYNGYLHLVPSLISWVTLRFFPLSQTPLVYHLFCMILTGIVVLNIYSKRFKIGHKALLSLSIVCVPQVAQEVFLNTPNIQWVLAILLIIVLLKDTPSSKYGNVHVQIGMDLFLLIICGLTGPFIILLIPFIIIKSYFVREKYNYILFYLIFILSFIQLFFVITTKNNIPVQLSNPSALAVFIGFVKVLSYRAFGILFCGKLTYSISCSLLLTLGFVLILIILWITRNKQSNKFFFSITFIGYGLLIILAALWQLKQTPLALLIAPEGERYFYVFYVMLAWSLILCLDYLKRWKQAPIYILLLLIAISSMSLGFYSKTAIFTNWPFYSKFIGKVKTLTIPIIPSPCRVKINFDNNVLLYKKIEYSPKNQTTSNLKYSFTKRNKKIIYGWAVPLNDYNKGIKKYLTKNFLAALLGYPESKIYLILMNINHCFEVPTILHYDAGLNFVFGYGYRFNGIECDLSSIFLPKGVYSVGILVVDGKNQSLAWTDEKYDTISGFM